MEPDNEANQKLDSSESGCMKLIFLSLVWFVVWKKIVKRKINQFNSIDN